VYSSVRLDDIQKLKRKAQDRKDGEAVKVRLYPGEEPVVKESHKLIPTS